MNLNATLIIQAIVFFILAGVTMKFIWPPLIAAIDDRRRKIAEGLASAEKGEKSLMEAKSSAADILKEARVQAGLARSFQITSVFDGMSVRDNLLVATQRAKAPGYG